MSADIVVPSIKHLNALWPLEWRERRRNPPAFVAKLPDAGGFLVQLELTNNGWWCWVSSVPVDYRPHQSFSIAVERSRVSTLDWLTAVAGQCRTEFDKLVHDSSQPPVLPLGSRPPKDACLEILNTYASEARDSGATLGEIAEATGLVFVDTSPDGPTREELAEVIRLMAREGHTEHCAKGTVYAGQECGCGRPRRPEYHTMAPPPDGWKLVSADRLYSALTMLIRAASEVSVDHSTERYPGRLAKMLERAEDALAEYRRAGRSS